MAHRQVCVTLVNYLWHFASGFAHRLTFPILVDQRFAVHLVHVVSHFASRFVHPLGFAFSFSVLPSTLPIIERSSTGYIFGLIVNDTHWDKLRHDFYMKYMDRSGFMFIIISWMIRIQKRIRQDFHMKGIYYYVNLEIFLSAGVHQCLFFYAAAKWWGQLGKWHFRTLKTAYVYGEGTWWGDVMGGLEGWLDG